MRTLSLPQKLDNPLDKRCPRCKGLTLLVNRFPAKKTSGLLPKLVIYHMSLLLLYLVYKTF